MVYQEFAPTREVPHYQADWAGEFTELRQSSLQAIGISLALLGYSWVFLKALAMHPEFAWAPLSLPLALGSLGAALLLVRRPHRLRAAIFIASALGVEAVGLWWEQSPAAPFLLVLVTAASALVGQPVTVFGVAGAGSILLLLAQRDVGAWPADIVLSALVMCWAAAVVSWLTSRNLYTVLAWALRGYESAWKTAAELQDERGKLNRTMRALSDANGLLKRTTYDLAEAREEAERARQLKGQFAANVSHELRTPLHLIVGFSQMMYASPDTYRGVRWTPELRGDVQEIYESAQHLLRLIDDVLDLSQVEAARLPLSKERISLAPLIRDAVATATSLLRGRGLYLNVDLPKSIPPLYADPTRIRQVLLNLLNNASRFTEEGGITVRARVDEEEVQVSVEDTGVGIPAEQIQQIFGEFHQVDSSMRWRYGGTGLGLSICKQFVSLHDGRIWVESELGKGSTFHFTLPLPTASVVRRQKSQVPAGWRYPASRPTKPRRLVTLTEPSQFRRLLMRYLTDVEVTAVERVDGLSAAVRRSQADAVVLAAGSLARSDVEKLARECRELSVPVIDFTLPLEEHLALAEGFTHCLMKPFGAEGLLGTLQSAAPAAETVLVVDDDPGVVRLVERYLRTAAHPPEVLAAYDGEEAIALLDRRPDLLLVDLMLPKANGLEVMRALRSRPWGATVPVVAITAYSFAQDVAALGQGEMTVLRGEHFSTQEMMRWLETVLQVMPAKHITLGEPAPGPAPAPTE